MYKLRKVNKSNKQTQHKRRKCMSLPRRKTCCYQCSDRYCGCHSECEKYKEFYIQNEKRKKYLQDFKKANDDYYGTVLSSLLKYNRR